MPRRTAGLLAALALILPAAATTAFGGGTPSPAPLGARGVGSSVAAAPAPPARAQAPAPTPRKPKLVVVLSIDGLSWQRLSEWEPWFTGGLARLLREGRVERAARYRHINSETGPGHAALGTGAPPRVTGIVANRWFEERDGAFVQVYCTDQPAPIPCPEADEPGEPASIPGPANLKVPTLGDRLLEASPTSRVVSFSGKDRGAIFLAGHDRRHTVYWYDNVSGRFVTSAAYDTTSEPGALGRGLVSKFNKAKAGAMLPGRFGLTWRKLSVPPPVPASVHDAPLPSPAKGIENHQVPVVDLFFDHDLTRNPSGYFSGIYSSPFVDELVVDLALTFLGDSTFQLGHQDAPDLLCLSLSAQDTVSHNYGFESEENLDTLRRLDVQLGRLFEQLDRDFPKGSVVVALSADHGFTAIPEVAKKTGGEAFTGGRLVYSKDAVNPFVDRLNRALTDELCLDAGRQPIRGTDGWNLVYDTTAFPARSLPGACGALPDPSARKEVTLADLDAAVPKTVRALFFEEVQDVFLVSRKDSWPADDPMTEFVRNDLFPVRSGDAFLIPREGVLMHWDASRGSGHGGPHEDSTRVPLIFWGGGIPAGRRDQPTTPYDLAPTLGGILGVTLPDAVGRDLKVR